MTPMTINVSVNTVLYSNTLRRVATLEKLFPGVEQIIFEQGTGTRYYLDGSEGPATEWDFRQGLKKWSTGERIPQATFSLDELFEAKVQELKHEAQREAIAYVKKYPEAERTSWSKQEEQAILVTADATAQAPLLEALATENAVTKTEMAQRILAKAAQFETAVGRIAGKRQRLENLAKSYFDASDREGLKSVTWS